MWTGMRRQRPARNYTTGKEVTYVVVKREPEIDEETKEPTGRMVLFPVMRTSYERDARDYLSLWRGQDLRVEYESDDAKIEKRFEEAKQPAKQPA